MACAGTMRPVARTGTHQITVEPGTERSFLGIAADIENPFHYPIEGICDDCLEPVIMRQPNGEWIHKAEWLKGE